MRYSLPLPARAAFLLALGCLGACSGPASDPSKASTADAADSLNPAAPAAPANSPLQVVAQFREPQIVGVAVLPDGRIFGDFPRWDNNPVAPIAEIGPNGSLKPYPDAE